MACATDRGWKAQAWQDVGAQIGSPVQQERHQAEKNLVAVRSSQWILYQEATGCLTKPFNLDLSGKTYFHKK